MLLLSDVWEVLRLTDVVTAHLLSGIPVLGCDKAQLFKADEEDPEVSGLSDNAKCRYGC